MGIQKHAAIAMSGLLLAGVAALTLGAATPASAVTGPQAMPRDIDFHDNTFGNVNNQQNGSNWNDQFRYLRWAAQWRPYAERLAGVN